MGVACDQQRVPACNYVVCLYILESLLFTLWPYVASEAVYSTTNLMAPCALLGIGCLLCSHARMLMYGRDGVALVWWQHTATARKIAVVLYYSSASLLLVLASCSAISSYVRTKIGPKHRVVSYAGTQLYVLDCVLCVYILTIALMSKAGLYVLVYVVYSCSLYVYPEVAYMFRHFYFLALFPTLY